jgi:hypothetical protein
MRASESCQSNANLELETPCPPREVQILRFIASYDTELKHVPTPPVMRTEALN